jgi:PAS domain S-box-containing protein
VPTALALRANEINRQDQEYERLKASQGVYKSNALLALGLITLLVLFIATWMALYVARTIAVPVQQLAQATEQIKRGDLSYRTDVSGDDELAALGVSFNEMAAALEGSNAALDERRRYIETILQSLSAGVISLDEHNRVTTINAAARRLLRLQESPASGVELGELLPEEQREELRRMARRAARLEMVTREVHFTLANQARLNAAVTVTALHDPFGEARGTVIVLEDLTELSEAQRRAAWSEVARRMAHEIKNPLTPIRLSAERLAKNLLAQPLDERQAHLVRECTSMIGNEVATLQRMVDEFSSFARLPDARPVPASLNEIVSAALKLYDERLDRVALESRLAAALPAVLADGEQIKRALVNLIDNAAEALTATRGGGGGGGGGGGRDGRNATGQTNGKITVETREDAAREVVELIVEDTGPGIAIEDRGRIFEPYFSTRKRGTGLGLAIVSRIVAEHQGRIRIEENLPRGARFIIELPTAKAAELSMV